MVGESGKEMWVNSCEGIIPITERHDKMTFSRKIEESY
jgi:hypothetical protein